MPHWFYKSLQKTCTFPFLRYNPKAGLIQHPGDYPFVREKYLRVQCKEHCLCSPWLRDGCQCSGEESGVTPAFVELELVTNSVIPSRCIFSSAKSKIQTHKKQQLHTNKTNCFHPNQFSFLCINFSPKIRAEHLKNVLTHCLRRAFSNVTITNSQN